MSNVRNSAPVAILKFDDVLQSDEGGGPVSPRWRRLADFVEKNRLKACFGIIGCALDGGDNKVFFEQVKDRPEMVRDYPPQAADNPAFYQWIIDRRKTGLVEFWLHGYAMRNIQDKYGEFERGTFEEHREIFAKSQRLARAKLGFELPAFGAHWSYASAEASRALEATPEIKIMFDCAASDTKKLALPAVMDFETSGFAVDFATFKATYERVGAGQAMLRLQGHPDKWDEQRWEEFVKIIEFLRAEGRVFMTASEYRELIGR